MELSKLQRNIAEAKEDKIVVISSAASGKTTTLTERVRYLISNQLVDRKKTYVITFTNLAAYEMRDRLGEGFKDIFIGTIHSLANYILRSIGVDTSSVLSEEKFDKLFEMIQDHRDAIPAADCIIGDEMQDSNEEQMEFLLDVLKPRCFTLFGDPRQSIYRFIDARPDILISIAKREDVKEYRLNENYRNAPEILDHSKMIIRQNGYDYLDDSVAMRKNARGYVLNVEYSPDSIVTAIQKKVELGDHYKDWFVLCRLNKDIDEFVEYCDKYNLPYDIIRRADFDTYQQLEEKMEKDTVKVMTVHQCVSGDTLVHTNQGIMKIEELVNTKPSGIMVYNGEEYAEVEDFIDNGEENVYEITTKYGNTVKVTENHNCICLDKEELLRKIKVKSLLGKEVLVKKEVPQSNEEVLLTAPDKEKIGFISKSKNERLVGIESKRQTKNKSHTLAKIIQKYKGCFKAPKNFWSNMERGSALTEQSFYNAYEMMPAEIQNNKDIQFIKWVFDNYQVEEVTSIADKGIEHTYCLTMKGRAQFLQNNFLFGNCKGLEADNVVVIGCILNKHGRAAEKEENTCINYVAATRARNMLVWTYSRHPNFGKKKLPRGINNWE